MAVGALRANGTVHSAGCFLIKVNTFRDNRSDASNSTKTFENLEPTAIMVQKLTGKVSKNSGNW